MNYLKKYKKYPKYVWFDKIDGEYFGRCYDLYNGYDEKIRYEIRDE